MLQLQEACVDVRSVYACVHVCGFMQSYNTIYTPVMFGCHPKTVSSRSRVVLARSTSTSVRSKHPPTVDMVPTVGVVSTIGCPHCKKAKAALKEKGVPYQEANLASAREVLAKVKETTGQTTVPQVRIRSFELPYCVIPRRLLFTTKRSMTHS